ncbi:hypothetical protein HanIR_Chr03g0134891 [Helianthus annuus]|nr:hypothetical protein HanIR_Chr03g0134891 [Helianthus annuus]
MCFGGGGGCSGNSSGGNGIDVVGSDVVFAGYAMVMTSKIVLPHGRVVVYFSDGDR